MDEVSLHAPTLVAELRDGEILSISWKQPTSV
jgi:anthranilate phosphoribosyltransferase